MAASSSSAFLAMRDENENRLLHQHQHQHQQQQLISSAPPASQPSAVAASASSSIKKRRNQPGNPNPDAEVIALSPKTLMATNRFVCEVCNKGFQREQNLQLHRRGHNLPWKLRQKSTKEVKRKVYLCPEPTCVHHDPSRALGDLTGIKKHYSRKHGEKKYKCDKCSKKYAVHSDWKAHSKTCGTREYRCDCGTLFSRRDSFITHRAFCDALAQESARNLNPPSLSSIGSHLLGLSQMSPAQDHQINHHQPNLSNHHDILRLGSGGRLGPQFETLVGQGFRPSAGSMPPSPALFLQPQVAINNEENQSPQGMLPNKPSLHGLMQLPQLQINNANTSSASTASLFNLSFFPSSSNTTSAIDGSHHSGGGEDHSTLFSSGNLMSIAIPSLYSASHALQNPSAAHMSATALLQKAAQLGSTTSNAGASSLLKSFGKSSADDHPSSLDVSHSFGGGSSAGVFGGNMNGGGNHLHDLVINSIANAGGSSSSGTMFGGGGAYSTGNHDDQQESSIGHDHHDHHHQHHQYRGLIRGNSMNRGGGFSGLEQGRLTRDFLGVGEIVRSVRDQQNNGMDMISSMDSQGKSGGSQSHGFGGGNLNFQ
ncbi:protein indeterminate-domain 5, chloroplastic [Sesamum alatum]|uniref:Protein indeterminate-domain 5, chloroplastic n=1 Tax=Sesamum alatum TaxID=300844 RepID=A0AAE1Y453_9LAMI|nr:protein indeterminate-domain 5, chloroplastic [Sesamum alatum]